MPRLFLLLFMLVSLPAHAAWLQLCPASQAGGPGPVAMMPDGREGRLVVAQQRGADDCISVPLGVPADQIEAVHPLPTGETPANTVLLQGAVKDGRFAVSGHTLLPAHPAPEPPAPMPLHANLLSHMQARAFGAEERVRARLSGGRLELSCAPGARPAGVLLTGPWFMPRARAAMRIQFSGTGNFAINVADTARARSESSLPMGSVNAESRQQSASVRLPDALDRAHWKQFVITCPGDGGTLNLSTLALEPLPGTPAPRAAWVWRASEWQQDPAALLAWAREEGILTLFIAIPLVPEGVREPAGLAAFVRQAHAKGIAVWSVDGDPHMVLPEERAATLARAKAYAAYNRGVDAAARLDGIQFDIEAYLLPAYQSAAADWDQRYLDLAQALREVTGALPLEFAVPYWWARKPDLLDGLARAADGLAVMDYRTDPGQIYAFAAPFLDWADRHGKRVRVALEAGRAAPETQRRYVKTSDEGDMVVAAIGGIDVLVVLRRPQRAERAYRLAATTVFDGSATTFHADKARLRALLPALERDFAAWPGFAGLALHELR